MRNLVMPVAVSVSVTMALGGSALARERSHHSHHATSEHSHQHYHSGRTYAHSRHLHGWRVARRFVRPVEPYQAPFGPPFAASPAWQPPQPIAPNATGGALGSLIAMHAQMNGVPESLVHRVIVRESRYNPHAVSRGNYGLMQIRLGTARAMGYTGSAAGLLDPNTNMTYAVRYLAGAYRAAGGNPNRAVSYYARGYHQQAKRAGVSPYAAAMPFGGGMQSYAAASGEPVRLAGRIRRNAPPWAAGGLR